MNLQHRIDLLIKLAEYMSSADADWLAAKEKASLENGWFIPEFINLAIDNITHNFLQKEQLENWVNHYPNILTDKDQKNIGVVMAGNIPLVGFHDWLSIFISGHKAIIKPSSKDKELITHIAQKMISWEKDAENHFQFAEQLKGCDAYIATGSNNSSRYFEYYFGKYPNIIRRNRTSVAILSGDESEAELQNLADDVYQYFGLGCRNVTKLYVPAGYDFVPLLEVFKKYDHLALHHKYKNNYDYNLALHLLNKVEYMTNGSILLVENENFFSPVSQLNFEYINEKTNTENLAEQQDIQCVVGKNAIPFGQAQCPS
ncbi:MAG: acyl-CoA reductase, partial [Chitinophagaceae bacterium]|nr:acyl-CoA reductase [Chitinophagaceae bacterium]